MDIIAGLLQTSILAGGVLALAALGEVLSERVGVVNLGVEGLMALGAITAIAIVTASPNPVLGLIGALGVGFVVGMIFASATVVLRANQVLCGLALTLMGTGLAATIGKAYSGMPARATFAPVEIPYLSELPLLGRALFTQNILVYLIYIVLPVALHFIMFRTRHGLNLRAVGENPAAADAAGISVAEIPLLVCRCGLFARGRRRGLPNARFRSVMVRRRRRRPRLDRGGARDLCRLSAHQCCSWLRYCSAPSPRSASSDRRATGRSPLQSCRCCLISAPSH